MTTIYTNEVYTIKKLNAERFCIVYEDDILCKYNRDREGLDEMIEDFLAFSFEDKLIRSHERKFVREELWRIFLAFAS